ncbi:MAG: protease pro-enzyme activation domain-containing protein, partial [Solirubrobacteraceae bacterium]
MDAPHGLRLGAAVFTARWAALLVCAILAVGPLAVSATAVAAPTATQVRLGAAPRHPSGSVIVGTLAGSTEVALTVTLVPRDQEALAVYASAVSTPGSGDYHRYLTVAEFRRRFGPTAARIAAVRAVLVAQGLVPGPTSANGLSIPLRASAGVIGRAFSLSFQRVRLHSGRVAYANTHAPQFPRVVASAVQGVVGLNTLTQARPLGLARARSAGWGLDMGFGPGLGIAALRAAPRVDTGGPQPCATAVSDAPGNDAYTADQLASAYEFSSLYSGGDLGAGQTVALFELEPNQTSDIRAYQSCYGTGTTVNYIKEDGGAGRGAGSGEAALDIEDVIGLAPDATVDVYQAPNTNTGLLDDYTAIVTSGANVVSTSWGECEADEDGTGLAASENTLFEEAATAGQSVFAAAGDGGSEDCGTDALAVDDPASQPDVTGVGGTTLSTLGPSPTQTVWADDTSTHECSDGPCGGGGGISSVWPMPSYQSGAPSSLNVLNGDSSGAPCGAATGSACRQVPDVSADADPYTGYLIYYEGAWTGIGGTSAAAPLWAAFTALVNASSSCDGTGIGFADPVLYRTAASDYAAAFDDITSGENDITATNGGLYPATHGYDMASGLGTPVGSALPQALCDAGVVPVVTVSGPGDQTGLAGGAVSLQIKASDSDGATLTYSATGLPAGLSIDSATGLISGTPTVAEATTVTVTAKDT